MLKPSTLEPETVQQEVAPKNYKRRERIVIAALVLAVLAFLAYKGITKIWPSESEKQPPQLSLGELRELTLENTERVYPTTGEHYDAMEAIALKACSASEKDQSELRQRYEVLASLYDRRRYVEENQSALVRLNLARDWETITSGESCHDLIETHSYRISTRKKYPTIEAHLDALLALQDLGCQAKTIAEAEKIIKEWQPLSQYFFYRISRDEKTYDAYWDSGAMTSWNMQILEYCRNKGS